LTALGPKGPWGPLALGPPWDLWGPRQPVMRFRENTAGMINFRGALRVFSVGPLGPQGPIGYPALGPGPEPSPKPKGKIINNLAD